MVVGPVKCASTSALSFGRKRSLDAVENLACDFCLGAHALPGTKVTPCSFQGRFMAFHSHKDLAHSAMRIVAFRALLHLCLPRVMAKHGVCSGDYSIACGLQGVFDSLSFRVPLMCEEVSELARLYVVRKGLVQL